MLRCMRAMNAANGAARVFSAVWLPGLTSGMKFSSDDCTRACRSRNLPTLLRLHLLRQPALGLGVGAEQVLVVVARDGELDLLAAWPWSARLSCAARRRAALAQVAVGARAAATDRPSRASPRAARRRDRAAPAATSLAPVVLLTTARASRAASPRAPCLPARRLLVVELADLLLLVADLLVLRDRTAPTRARPRPCCSSRGSCRVARRLLGDAVVLLRPGTSRRAAAGRPCRCRGRPSSVVVPLGRRRLRRLGHRRHRRQRRSRARASAWARPSSRAASRARLLLRLLLSSSPRASASRAPSSSFFGRLERGQVGRQLRRRRRSRSRRRPLRRAAPPRATATRTPGRRCGDQERGVKQQRVQRSTAEMTALSGSHGWGHRGARSLARVPAAAAAPRSRGIARSSGMPAV